MEKYRGEGILNYKEDSIVVSLKGDYLNIYINNQLHVAVNKSELFSMDSWVECKFITWCRLGKKYCIEFTSKSGVTLRTEYVKRENWSSILELLNSFI